MFPVLRTGDLIQFTMLGPHIVPRIMAPFPLVGKGTILKDYMPVCVIGDELPTALRTAEQYIGAKYTVAGNCPIAQHPQKTELAKWVF